MTVTHRPRTGPPLALPAAVATLLTLATGLLFAAGPRPGTPAGEGLDWLRAHDGRAGLVAFLLLGTSMPLAVTGATAYRRLRQLGVTAPGAAIALVGSVLASAALAVSGLVLWATAHAADDLAPGTARVLLDLSFATGGVGFTTPLALLLAGAAVPALVLRLTPAPLAWTGLALAAVAAVSSLGLLTSALYPLLPVARFGGLLWLVVIAVALPATRRRTS